MFLRNHWYVAAWSEDVGRTPIGRVMLGEAVVLYRTGDGRAVALEDRCPHRNLPLSRGRLKGDVVQCGYHGLEFGADGVCIHVPGQETVPEWARVQRYPVAEKNRWVFVWMGHPDEADKASVPDYAARTSDPEWLTITGYQVVGCGYRLILDNLLDLSHLAYVHARTTGNLALAENAVLSTSVDGDTVRIIRRMADVEPAPAFREFGGFAGNIDRWQASRFLPPSYIDINNGADDAGAGATDDEQMTSQGKWGFVVYHAMTPESLTTTHQFWVVSIPRHMVPADMRESFLAQMDTVIPEDTEVYEAQQSAIDLDPEALDGDVNPKGALPIDQALLEMRRVIRRLHRTEQSVPVEPTHERFSP